MHAFAAHLRLRSRRATRFLSGMIWAFLNTTALAQNSMIGDGFGGRLWYRPTNYTVGSYSAFSVCYTDPCDSASNQLYGWGGDNVGELANGPGFNCTSTPAAIPGMSDIRYFSTGYWMGVIKNDGTGWVWGGTDGFSTPTQVITDVKFVDASARLVSFVKSDGTVWSIGFNDFGQFGDGTTTSNYTAPTQMAGITNAVRVAVGLFATYVLLADGTVMSVGSNTWGLLGDPTNTAGGYTTTPAPVPGLMDIIEVKATSVCGAALDASGDVFTWGQGGYTGDGDQLNDTLPERLVSLADVVAISGCTDGTHILTLDAERNCHVFGQYNFNTTHPEPMLITDNVVDIMAGETFSYLVKADGTLWASGSSLCGSIWMNQPNFLHPSVNQVLTQLDPSDVPGSCPLVGTVATSTATCSSGTITVHHFGGEQPYQYDIGYGPQASNEFTNVPLGNYTVTVTDANGCVTTVPCTVDSYGAAPIVENMGTVSSCTEEGYTLPSGTTVFAPGIYADTVYSVLGCDTVRLFEVALYDGLPLLNWQITLCEGEVYALPNGDLVTAPGVFFIDTLEYANACDTLFSISLILSTLPPLEIFAYATDSNITEGESTLLVSMTGESYSWFPSGTLSCSDCQTPTATPTETTVYCVILDDGNFCSPDTACVEILVLPSTQPSCTSANIFVPTAFSPNASDKNDLQCVLGAECIASMRLGIYDRWGNKVFETSDPEACWDGTYNGQALDPAVFVYQLIATLNNGELVERQGNITLVR
jgi:gliding motility-associated-like protein